MALEPLFFFPGNTMKGFYGLTSFLGCVSGTSVIFLGNTMKGFYGLTSFRGCVLTWLTTLNLDRGKDWSFDISYHDSPVDTYLKNFINAYRCVCWMKSTSIDGLDGPYICPWYVFMMKLWIFLLPWLIFLLSVDSSESWFHVHF